MQEISKIQEIVFQYFNQCKFDEADLDYSLVPKHIETLRILANVSNSGTQIFDLNRKQSIFFSPNFGKVLGYTDTDYERLNYQFFESKIHHQEQRQLALNGLASLKLFNTLSSDEKLNHKVIHEYKMLNAEGKYVRLVEQYQVLELDKKGQIWLMLSIVDVSPNQESDGSVKSQVYNYKTGNIIPMPNDEKPQLELTKRELEILKLVKEGYLSKEISDKLSISVHTVNTHRYRFLEKLGANNSFEAVVFASKYGLLN
jgi:DNA-binding CsgD family transcriptional regulator/PAS domain-containing protein